MLLPNGSMIKNDVIEAFDFAVGDPSNQKDGGINWDFVSADMHMDLFGLYSDNYIHECFEALVDSHLAWCEI